MFEDLTVLEIGQVLAGPYAGAILADLGATVIKIEKPQGGDDGRRMGAPFLNDDSLTFTEFNRGKRSVTLDLKSPEGLEQLHDLADRADALIHNLRPDVPRAIGIEPERFCARHPRLIYCEISSFGSAGPMQFEPSFEALVQAYSGIVSSNGDPAGPPSRLPISAVDLGTSMWTVIGLLSALREREKTGRGTIVRTSLFETALGWMSQRINAFLNQGVDEPRQSRSAHPGLVPYQSFAAADGDLFVAVGNDRHFAKFAHVLERDDWVTNPAFVTNRLRLSNRAALVAEIDAVVAARPRAFWLERLSAVGVPCAPVNDVRELVTLEQFTAVDMLSPELGASTARLVSLPITFDGKRPHPRGVAPRLGENDTAPFPATS
ncbi:MAG: CoA transferase [Candidatus Velthaea sp.]|jgi:formyl-CoA transferase